jgi:GTP cyclohydrolase I
MKKSISEKIRDRLKEADQRFFASDNIAEFIEEGEKEQLIEELADKFEGVIDSLVIDRVNDNNSRDTPHRLAKMYINELMSGRYEPEPKITAFPNDYLQHA